MNISFIKVTFLYQKTKKNIWYYQDLTTLFCYYYFILYAYKYMETNRKKNTPTRKYKFMVLATAISLVWHKIHVTLGRKKGRNPFES